MQTILLWVAQAVLKWSAEKAYEEARDALLKANRDKERGEINDLNLKKYREATDRAERTKAAIDLLNRTDRREL